MEEKDILNQRQSINSTIDIMKTTILGEDLVLINQIWILKLVLLVNLPHQTVLDIADLQEHTLGLTRIMEFYMYFYQTGYFQQ